jgi:hypothetical protein
MYYFLSYPKCGRTWVFAMIGKYIAIKKNLPDREIVMYAYDRIGKTGYLPMKKSHGGFAALDRKIADELQEELRNFPRENLIVLTRNPYDTVLSYYHDCRLRKPLYKGTLTEFIQDSLLGAANLKKFNEFVKSLNPNYVLSYEEVHQNPVESIEPIIKLLLNGEDVDLDVLRQAVQYCEADNLRELEEKFRQRKGGVDMKSQQSMRKVRKAVVGSYEEEMTQEQIDMITDIMGGVSL